MTSSEDKDQKEDFPVLPLRDIVVFPHMIVPLFVGREKSVRALEDVGPVVPRIAVDDQQPLVGRPAYGVHVHPQVPSEPS